MNYQKVYMNQIYTSSLVGQVAHMWRNQLLCDAVIKTGNINTKAHRLVLIAACPMLQHMENASVGSHLEVRLSADIKQSSVTTFLQYLYEGFMMLTEENCKDVEKIGKLLHVDSVVKCCIDFYKCLSSKTGAPITEGSKFDNQDQLEFRYVRATELQKTLQDSALKRSSSDNVRPASPQSKRQRVHRPGSPPHSYSIQRSTPQRTDDRFSMAHSYSSPQDPFERVPRLGSGMNQGRPLSSGVIEIIEDSVEVINTEPRERDSEGWPKQSDLPPMQRSMSVSVSSQISADQDVQIVNVSNSGSQQTTKTSTSSSSSSSRHSSDPISRQSLESTIEIAPVRTHEPTQPRPPELTRPSDRQPVSFVPDNSNVFRTSEPTSFSNSNVESARHSDQLHDSSVTEDNETATLRQQSQSTPTKQSIPNISNIPLQRSVHSQLQMRSMPAPQSKPFAAGSASQTSQSSSPLAASASPMAASPRSQSGETSHPPVQSPVWSGQDGGQKLQQYTQQIQSDDVERLLAPDTGDPGSVTSSKSDTQQQSPSDCMADLSIVKIEEAPDTGGLDMYVDFPEDQKNIVSHGDGDDHDKSYESEEPSIDWTGEEFSNEGSNLSADQSGMSWQAQGQSGSLNKGLPESSASLHVQMDESYGQGPRGDNSARGGNPGYLSIIPCKICGMQMKDFKSLNNHLKLHGYCAICKYCGKLFKSHSGLVLHMKIMHRHGSPEDCPKCEICGKILQTRSHLIRHKKTHSNERNFACFRCNKHFKHKNDLKRHLTNHCRFSKFVSETD